jgi:hypothetical protein
MLVARTNRRSASNLSATLSPRAQLIAAPITGWRA